MDKKKKSHHRMYRPSIMVRAWFSLILIAFSFAFIAMLTDLIFNIQSYYTNDGLFAIVFYLLTSYGVFCVIWFIGEFVFNLKLEITSDGIWLHQYGKRFYPWDTMVSLDTKSPLFRYTSNWGIHAEKAKIIHHSSIGKWLIGNWIYNNYIPLDLLVRIPRKWIFFRDIEKFKKTEFGQGLYHYAPHLFEDYDDGKPKNRLEDGYAEDSQSDWLEELQSEESKRG